MPVGAMDDSQHDITQALLEAYDGDEVAAERLWAMVYPELQRLAHRELRAEDRGRTLDTNALVHDAYFKLVDQTRCSWRNRKHFFALACKAMRRILVDHARYRNAQKRQAQKHRVTLDEAVVMAEVRSERLLALDEALAQLEEMDERLAQVVECRFFGGLSVVETAELLEVSTRTVERDWQRAQIHLYKALRED